MKTLLRYDFDFAENLQPVVDNDGSIKEFYPQKNYEKHENATLHKYGSGAFCRFSIDTKWSGLSGVYAFFINDELVYIGQCIDLAKRFNMGYGNISPRNCFIGGQSTNCKINKVVLESAKFGKTTSIYFHETLNYNAVERALIAHYKPKHNAMR